MDNHTFAQLKAILEAHTLSIGQLTKADASLLSIIKNLQKRIEYLEKTLGQVLERQLSR